MKILIIFLFISHSVGAQTNEMKIIPQTWEQIEKSIKELNSTLKCDGSHSKTGSVQAADGHALDLTIIDWEGALKVFKEISNREDILFKYPKDGCYARAHVMSWALDDQNIQSGKVFVLGDLEVKTANSPQGKVHWNYHVAPIVLIDHNGVIEPYVFDPAIFDKPVLVTEWVKIQTQHATAKVDEVFFTERFNYSPYIKTAACEYNDLFCQNAESSMKKFKNLQDTQFPIMPACEAPEKQ